MNISRVTCTPIKPQVSFGNLEDCHEELHEMAAERQEQKVDSNSIKDPLTILASLAALAGIAYGGGKKVATGVSAIYEKVAPQAKNLADDAAKVAKDTADDAVAAAKNAKLGIAVENGLKKASGLASKGINALRTTADDAATLTKSQKAKNFVADKLDDGLALAKKTYKKVAYHGVPETASAAEKAQAVVENLGGVVGLATVVPEVASRDANKNGVYDLVENSQNAYTRVAEGTDRKTEELGILGKIIENLT